jgi:hypothetical protein
MREPGAAFNDSRLSRINSPLPHLVETPNLRVAVR